MGKPPLRGLIYRSSRRILLPQKVIQVIRWSYYSTETTIGVFPPHWRVEGLGGFGAKPSRVQRVPEKVPEKVAEKVPEKLVFLLFVFMHVHTAYMDVIRAIVLFWIFLEICFDHLTCSFASMLCFGKICKNKTLRLLGIPPKLISILVSIPAPKMYLQGRTRGESIAHRHPIATWYMTLKNGQKIRLHCNWDHPTLARCAPRPV